MKAMPIRNTGKLITDCWLRAEQSLREVVKKKFRDRDEEIITELFRAELETEFATASEKGTVERAFLEDLKQELIAELFDQESKEHAGTRSLFDDWQGRFHTLGRRLLSTSSAR